MTEHMKKDLGSALKETVPVMTGYLVLGIGFGMIMKANGYGILWSLAMSLFVYAGSMQYAAIGLLTGGAPLFTVALTTLAVNARHIFYGISMTEKYKGLGIRKPYMIFALTDETYSLVCTGEKSSDRMLFISVLDHIYWVSGTLIGALLADALPFDTRGMDFALTAMFITIFTEQWLNEKDHFAAVSGVLVSSLCLVIFGADKFLIPAMAVILAVLLLAMKGREQK